MLGFQFESQTRLDKTQRELMLLRNEFENLQVIHKEKLDQLRSLEESSSSNLQSQMKSHLEEISKLQEKLETQALTLTTKEQAIVTVNLSLEQL